MRRNWTIALLIIPLAVLFAGPLSAYFGPSAKRAAMQSPDAPTGRTPRGIYAKINITSEILKHPHEDEATLETYFKGLFAELLANPATSGLAIQEHWDTLNPNSPDDANPYDWTFLDDAFNQIELYNIQNLGTPPKTIQLILTPGYQTPGWVLDHLSPCDGLFTVPATPVSHDCGKVPFVSSKEQQDQYELPMPWNDYYKNAWHTFLEKVNDRYGSRSEFVSIAVAGPTASSEEMIVPNDSNTDKQVQFSGNTGITADQMWIQLLQNYFQDNTAYLDSDAAFALEWDDAIDMYGRTFKGLTLIATTGSGFPNFTKETFKMTGPFAPACLKPNMDCFFETSILSYFAVSTTAMNDRKATQTSGLEASRAGHEDLGMKSIEVLTGGNYSPAILGGAQFNTSFSQQPQKEGSAPKPEHALFNVLGVFFAKTPVASFYCKEHGDIPLNYMQIYSTDFVYAANPANGPVTFTTDNCGTFTVSAQQELNLASAQLLSIAQR
jgi:hypothetical protein